MMSLSQPPSLRTRRGQKLKIASRSCQQFQNELQISFLFVFFFLLHRTLGSISSLFECHLVVSVECEKKKIAGSDDRIEIQSSPTLFWIVFSIFVFFTNRYFKEIELSLGKLVEFKERKKKE